MCVSEGQSQADRQMSEKEKRSGESRKTNNSKQHKQTEGQTDRLNIKIIKSKLCFKLSF